MTDPRAETLMHLSPEALAGYLDHDLSSEEQGRVELHLVSCTECRDELAEVGRFQLGRRRRRVLALAPAAAAAAVLLAVALPRQTTTPSDLRAGPDTEPLLGVVTATAVAPGPITFIWRSAGREASYTVTLQEPDGPVIWTSTVAETVAVLPDSVVLSPGVTRFWSVDALLPDGKSRSSGVRRLRIPP